MVRINETIAIWWGKNSEIMQGTNDDDVVVYPGSAGTQGISFCGMITLHKHKIEHNNHMAKKVETLGNMLNG